METASGQGAQLFTRGLPNAVDTRGETMVQKHLARLQAEKEKAALDALRETFADLAPAVLTAALEEVAWEAPSAIDLLQAFQIDRAPELELIKERARLIPETAGRQKRSRQGDSPASSGSIGADSDDSEAGAAPKQKKSKSAKEKSSKKSKKKKKEKKEKRTSREKEAKPRTKEALTSTDGFGKYGIIRESDMYSKRSEFSMWATEVQKVDIETLPKFEEKDLFRTFMEDFNTGTLPHKKYYNLDLYEQRRAEKAAKNGRPLDAEKSVFNDEDEVRRAAAAARAAAQEERLRDAYNELKYTAPGKAEEMREQELMRMHMNLAYRTGDHEKATRIQEKLKPDAEKDPRHMLNPP